MCTAGRSTPSGRTNVIQVLQDEGHTHTTQSRDENDKANRGAHSRPRDVLELIVDDKDALAMKAPPQERRQKAIQIQLHLLLVKRGCERCAHAMSRCKVIPRGDACGHARVHGTGGAPPWFLSRPSTHSELATDTQHDARAKSTIEQLTLLSKVGVSWDIATPAVRHTSAPHRVEDMRLWRGRTGVSVKGAPGPASLEGAQPTGAGAHGTPPQSSGRGAESAAST